MISAAIFFMIYPTLKQVFHTKVRPYLLYSRFPVTIQGVINFVSAKAKAVEKTSAMAIFLLRIRDLII